MAQSSENSGEQELRDAHFLESGVDAKGNTPKGKTFDGEGKEVAADYKD